MCKSRRARLGTYWSWADSVCILCCSQICLAINYLFVRDITHKISHAEIGRMKSDAEQRQLPVRFAHYTPFALWKRVVGSIRLDQTRQSRWECCNFWSDLNVWTSLSILIIGRFDNHVKLKMFASGLTFGGLGLRRIKPSQWLDL